VVQLGLLFGLPIRVALPVWGPIPAVAAWVFPLQFSLVKEFLSRIVLKQMHLSQVCYNAVQSLALMLLVLLRLGAFSFLLCCLVFCILLLSVPLILLALLCFALLRFPEEGQGGFDAFL